MFKRIDIASLVAFRILFGMITTWEVWRYLDADWIPRYYLSPTFHFTYYGFGWVSPWPGNGMYAHFAVLGVAAAFITVGFLYRLSTAVFFLGFTYLFLLDQTQYLNHFYFVSLITFLMIFVPPHRAMSVDAWMRPRLRSQTAPAWALWILRAQVGIVYFYAGVAKLNSDWLHGEPMRAWLAGRSHYTMFGPLLPAGKLFNHEWVVYLFAYGGLGLDLLAPFLLLWRRTRPWAFAAIVFFHLTNAWLFDIGIFPWFALAATLLFFDPSWPRRVFNWPPKEEVTEVKAQHEAGLPSPGAKAVALRPRRWRIAFWSFYFAVQVLVPLRHFLYPGPVHWTEEGHRFSWHMKLRDKEAVAIFKLTDPVSGQTWTIDPVDYLSRRQASKMAARPDMVLQFAHFLAKQWRAEGYEQIEVRGLVQASLNGRPAQLLVDPNVDLGKQPRDLWPASWIMPLEDVPPGSRAIEPQADQDVDEPM